MKLLSKYIFSALFLAASGGSATAQSMRANTYCNPLNVDYTYMIYNSSNNLSYRSGADPAVVEFRGEYYMFVTRSHGYWHSTDLLNWDFITPGKNWYPQGSNAPAAHNYKDSVLYVMGDPSGSMSVLYTDDPVIGTLLLLYSTTYKTRIYSSMMTGKLIYSGALPMFIRFGARN